MPGEDPIDPTPSRENRCFRGDFPQARCVDLAGNEFSDVCCTSQYTHDERSCNFRPSNEFSRTTFTHLDNENVCNDDHQQDAESCGRFKYRVQEWYNHGQRQLGYPRELPCQFR